MKHLLWLSSAAFLVVLSGLMISQTRAQEGLPDLAIQSITVTHKLKKMAVVVKNQGDVRAGRRGSVRMAELAYWWVDSNGEHVGPVLTRWVPSLPVNAKYTINFTKNTYPLPTLPKGAKTLRFKIDYSDAIVELDEANNFWQAEPKSKNTALSAAPWVETPVNWENPTYTVAPNQESNQSSTNPSTNFNWENPTYTTTPAQTEPTQTTPASNASRSDAGWPESSSSSSSSSPTTVNPAALPRANCLVSVEANPVSGGDYDLILKSGSVYYAPKPAKTSASVKFWATVLNVGTETTGPKRSEYVYSNADIGDSDTYLCLDTNNDGLWDIVKTTYTNPLDSQHYALKSMTWMTPAKGTHRWQVCADGGNKVIETNETNNCTEGTFTVN